MRKQYQKVMSAAVWVAASVAGRVLAGSLDPTNGPGPTMHTLEEIYQKVDAVMSPQTLSDTTTVVNAGCYAATDLALVETDLVSTNIRASVTLFGIVGTLGNVVAPLPKTGQTASYFADDDGALQKGVAWPNPRFTVQTDTNCVLDNLTGLMWARDANLFGPVNWSAAEISCNELSYGGYTDWRLPNIRELFSLIHLARCFPALCNTAGDGVWTANDPFTGVQLDYYWSSTTDASTLGNAWYVSLLSGFANGGDKASVVYAWPVRGGL